MNGIDLRYKEYNKSHCWQFDIRLRNYEQDLKDAQLTKEEAEKLTIKDFTFSYIDKTDKSQCQEVVNFIKKHEWLGNMPLRPTHRFIARYKNILAGVIVMATPNTFSHILGKDLLHLEKLISRGACISWSPKNLGSALLMWSIHWMVQNTYYRVFTAYSDIEAKELGTIYQACNFYYLGKGVGTKKMYKDPQLHRGWFSDRTFRVRAAYKRYAKQLNITWQPHWNDEKDRILWHNMPKEIELALRNQAKAYQVKCISREVPPKHKYCYILGKDKRETKLLRGIFESLHAKLSYPKERGK